MLVKNGVKWDMKLNGYLFVGRIKHYLIFVINLIELIHLKIILEYRNNATKPIKRQTTEILIMQQKGAGQQLRRATRGDNCY